MRKFNNHHFFLLLLLFHLLLGCAQNEMGGPLNPKNQIKNAIWNWRILYGDNVAPFSFEYAGKIEETQFETFIMDIVDPTKAWFPSIDISRGDTMMALRIIDDSSIKNEKILEWQNMIRNKVRIGHHIFKIKWYKGKESFSTSCIADDSTLIYDSMLFNVLRLEKRNSCVNYTFGWLWEDLSDCTRGKISVDINPNCREGVLIACETKCEAEMSAGMAEVRCKLKSSREKNCCELEYNWAWACGFKEIIVKPDGFNLEIEGVLGSSGSGGGNCSECCNPVAD